MERQASLFRRAVVEIGIFSAVVNLLLLAMPLYLLQIYDRVLPSSSTGTLIYLSVFAVGSIVVLGFLEAARALYAERVSARMDRQLAEKALSSSMNSPQAASGDVRPLRDLATLRSFANSRSIFFLFDLPFAPLFITFLYFIHPVLFYATLVGAFVLLGLTIANQITTAKHSRSASDAINASMTMAQIYTRQQETVRALGMAANVTNRWGKQFAEAQIATAAMARRNAIFGGMSRAFRILLQIAVLGLGAWLVLNDEMTAGMIFAASIISGRALQPLDQIIGSWRQIVDVRRAYRSLLSSVKTDGSADNRPTELPVPKGSLAVENLLYFAPGADAGSQPLIKRINFSVGAGELIAIIGPSKAGKSTLARLIVGAIRPRSGSVRIDGADISQWDANSLGAHVGYMSQEVELFPGTIGENIARFSPDATDDQIVMAAKRAHAHETILTLPSGYDTDAGPGGVRLSGGEKQRIGLSRAMYGNPKLLVLDEPNANLDMAGEQALQKAVLEAKEAGVTVILITHRPTIARKCDRVLMLRDGSVELYGPAADVLARLAQGGNGGPPDKGVKQSVAGNKTTHTASFSQVMNVKNKKV